MKNKKIKMTSSAAKNEPAKWYDKKWAKRILTALIVVVIGIPVWYACGKLVATQYGFETSDEAIKNVMISIQNNDKLGLTKSFDLSSKHAGDVTDVLTSYAKQVKGTYELSLLSEYTKFDERDIDPGMISSLTTFMPDSAKYTVVSVESKQTRNDFACNGICLYEATTYRYNGKWYVDSFNEVDYEIISMNYTPEDSYMSGSTEVGWLPVSDDEWTIISSENAIFENSTALCCSYNGDSHDSTIVMSALQSVTSIEDAAEKITDVLSEENNCFGIFSLDDELNGMKCRRIMTTYLVDDQIVTTYTWLVKNTIKDPYVHQITLTTTDSIKTFPIIMGYRL